MNEKMQAGQGGVAAVGADWENLVAQWKRSGQSQKAFCVERRLVLSTVQWWCTRAKRRGAAMVVKPFLPIAVHAPSVVEVELRSPTRIRFEGEAALQAVARLTARVE